MNKWTFLGLAIALEAIASLSLKAALDSPGFYALVVFGYVSSFMALFAGLRHGLNLGVGYGIWGASGVALTAILSFLIFHEPLTLTMTLGIVVVMAGVLLVEIGSQNAHKKKGVAS